jgi:hypothetical protein
MSPEETEKLLTQWGKRFKRKQKQHKKEGD